MARKKPSRQKAKDSYDKSEAPRRIAAEKDERVVADTNLANTNTSQDTSLTNVQNTNAAQTTSIADLGQRVGSLETRITNQEAVNTAQQTNITGLVNFQNRAAGFATEGHLHDERYYGRGQTDTLFLRHASHPLGPQLHGSGYHA